MTANKKETILFSTDRITPDDVSPIVAIGLPRSGSSYLAHILTCQKDWFVFDDLYPLQKARALGISNSCDLSKAPKLAQQYIHSLSWALRAKIRHEKNFHVPNMTWEDTFKMEECVLSAMGQQSFYWNQILQEWMSRIALFSGKKHWGYKTPQDFMHMNEIAAVFPNARFIYIHRDPRNVLKSLKNLPFFKTSGSEDGESSLYHPYAYSRYWRSAFESVQSYERQNPDRVIRVKFENLIADPVHFGKDMAKLLNTELIEDEVVPQSVNTSYKKSKKIELNGLEIYLCEKVIGQNLILAGYKPTPKYNIHLVDPFKLLARTGTFTFFQAKRFLSDPRSRQSIKAFITRT